jgi:parallel beta-helix repeat protein
MLYRIKLQIVSIPIERHLKIFGRLLWVVGLILILSLSSLATSFTVTNIGDNAGVNPAVGAATGTLRQAIVDANADATATTAAPHNITFTGGGIGQINLSAALPALTRPIKIDGGTIGTVVINGGASASITWGFLYNSANSAGSILTNLVISNFSGTAVNIQSPAITIKVTSCRIGTNSFGTGGWPNSTGIMIVGSANGGHTISNNIISGNSGFGLQINGSINNTITGNYFGISSDGTTPVPNSFHNIQLLNSANNNTIGGNTSALRNIISACNQRGISIENNSTGNIIKGNYIGLDATGTTPRGNVDHGLYVGSGCNSTIIGGNHTLGEGNVISACGSGSGIFIESSSSHIIKGNYIGLNAAGTVSVAGPPFFNGGSGIYIRNNSRLNTIGSNTAGEGNVIAGNRDRGIILLNACNKGTIQGNYVGIAADGLTAGSNFGNVSHNIELNTTDSCLVDKNIVCSSSNGGVYLWSANHNTITGNYAGVAKDGLTAYGNGWDGIGLDNGSDYNMIGGTTAAARNVCCAGTSVIASGIAIKGGAAGLVSSYNYVLNNYCGVGADGVKALGNQNFGIYLGYHNATNNVVGTPAYPNIVANNITGGIWLEEAGTFGNSLRGNSVYCNGPSTMKGINLNGAANANTPAPVISSLSTNSNVYGSGLAVGDTIDLYYIDVTCHDCSTPQGKTYIATVFANASGNWSYTGGVTNFKITATVTKKATGNTSEYATCTTLPVTFIGFTAERNSTGQIVLHWSTSSEKNNDHFVVERSLDGKNFEAIDNVKGNGNSNSINNYEYVDYFEAPGVVYYRLKQVDIDGRYDYSKIVHVTSPSSNDFSVYPNPLSSGRDLQLDLSAGERDESVTIQIVDAVGQTVIQYSGEGLQHTLSVSSLSKGVYFVWVSTEDFISVKKLVIK